MGCQLYHLNFLDKVKHLYSHLADIGFSHIDVGGDISILIGADNPMLHICMDIRVGNENEPVAPKTKLGLVTFGERQNTNKYPNISTFFKEFDAENIVSKFWQIESYGVLERLKPKHFTTNGTTCFKDLKKKLQQTQITTM